MTESFSTVCEHCSATLKLKNPDLVGKRVKCPKCGESFVVSEPSSGKKKPAKKITENDDDFMNVDPDDYDSPADDEDDGEERRSVRRQKSSHGGKKKSKKSKGGTGAGKIVAILAIVLVSLGVLGGGGYAVVTLAKGSGSSELDWLPTEIDGYTKIQVDDLWKSAIVQPLTGSEPGKKFSDETLKNIGMGPQDVDNVVIGMLSARGNASQVMVMRSKVPFDWTKLQGSAEKPEYVSHAGSQYLKNGDIAVFLADAKTLVRGSEANVQAIMTRGKQNPSASKFGFARGFRDHVVVAYVNTSGSPSPAMGSSPMMGFPTNPLHDKDTESLLVRANAGSDVNVSVQATYKTADAAKRDVERAQADITKGKTQMSQTKSQMQNMGAMMGGDQAAAAKKMLDGAEQTMNTIKVTQSGTRMNVQLSVSGQLVRDVIDMAEKFKSSPLGRSGPSPIPSLFGN